MALKLEAGEQLGNRPACLLDLQGYREAYRQLQSLLRSRLPCWGIVAARGEGGGASDLGWSRRNLPQLASQQRYFQNSTSTVRSHCQLPTSIQGQKDSKRWSNVSERELVRTLLMRVDEPLTI
jgi:hypothetical protein